KITGVAHTHSTCATAWAQACREIPVLGTTHADHFYGSIPCTLPLSKEEIERNYEGNIGKSIVEKFRNLDPIRIQAVLVAKHGPITWGDGPEQAVENSVILEEIADLAKRTLMISPETEEIEKHLVEKHFLRKWGPDADFYQKKTTSVGIKQNSVPYKKP
ncbi:MAG: L-ribulose-5-phosphate 4-epimerase, partial [Proteobacteria bacterium]|nr:L-ribulose-5-phosphate 4-epimerase [Pseudomonadota bacterium]